MGSPRLAAPPRQLEEIAQEGSLLVGAVELGAPRAEPGQPLLELGLLRDRLAQPPLLLGGLVSLAAELRDLVAEPFRLGIADLGRAPERLMGLAQLREQLSHRAQAERRGLRQQQIVDMRLRGRVEPGELRELERVDGAEHLARDSAHAVERAVPLAHSLEGGVALGHAQPAATLELAKGAQRPASGSLDLRFQLEVVRSAVPLRQRVRVTVGGIEAVEDGLERRAKGRFSRLVRPEDQRSPGRQLEDAVAQRAEDTGLEAAEPHVSSATRLRCISSSGSSASSDLK